MIFSRIQTPVGALLTITSFANDFSAFRYVLRYKLGILEGERMIRDRYFWRDADSCRPKLKFSREIVIVYLSKNELVCENAVRKA